MILIHKDSQFLVVEGWLEKPDINNRNIGHFYPERLDAYESAIASYLSRAIPVIQEDYEKVRELIVTDIRSGFNEVDTLLKVVMIQDLTPYSVEVELEKVEQYRYKSIAGMAPSEWFTADVGPIIHHTNDEEYRTIYRIKQSTK